VRLSGLSALKTRGPGPRDVIQGLDQSPLATYPANSSMVRPHSWLFLLQRIASSRPGGSPTIWKKLRLNYQESIFGRYGLAGSGCCENLTLKIGGVLSIPNLCIFVCSAGTCLEAVQHAVGQDYVIMWRQKASDVVFPDDVETIHHDLEEECRQLQSFPRWQGRRPRSCSGSRRR
jgi:hypothetical protein